MSIPPRTRTAVAVLAFLVTLVAAPGCITNNVLRERGYAEINRGDWVAAHAQFARAVEREPSDALAQYYLGLCELKTGEPAKAQLTLEKALTLKPDDPTLTPRILNRLAEAIYQQDRPQKLVAFLNQTVAERDQPEDYARQADYLNRLGDHDNALIAYQKAALFAPPGDARPYVALADFYSSINNAPAATEALRHAYYENPAYPGLNDRLRTYGIVPGPTVGVAPPKPSTRVDASTGVSVYSEQ